MRTVRGPQLAIILGPHWPEDERCITRMYQTTEAEVLNTECNYCRYTTKDGTTNRDEFIA